MPAQQCSPDRQNDAASLRSSPPHPCKLPCRAGEDGEAKEEEGVKELHTEMEPPTTDSCARSVSAPAPAEEPKEEEEEEKQSERVAAVVKEDSDSSRDAEEELSEYAYIDLHAIRKEVQCPICLGIIKKTRTVMECLHRFCRECIDKSMRMGNNECPACRTHCASRRSLRDDPRYDALITALFPDIEKYEAEELAFCEEEKTRNKQIQASIAQIFKLQSEALGKKRSRKRIRDPSPSRSRKNNRETPSRRSKRKRRVKPELESDDDEDLENIEGQTSSYSGEQYAEIDQQKHTTRRQIGSSHHFTMATSSGGACTESKLENKRSYPGIMWNIEMRTWGKNGVRSGHIRKNLRSARLTKLKEFLQNLEEDECVISNTSSAADKQFLAASQPPQPSHDKEGTLNLSSNIDDKGRLPEIVQCVISKTSSAADKQLLADNQPPQPSHDKEDTLYLSSNIDDKGRLSEIVDQFRDRLQLSEEKKTLPKFEANCISQGGQLLLACRQKEAI